MREFVNAATVITTGTLAAGFAALLLAVDGRVGAAAVAVLVAATFDAADGVVARRLSRAGRFGTNLDSLADLVAFGVAPALMLYQAILRDLPVVGAAVATVFVLAGAWRLARFPLVEDAHRFVGLPIPPAGVVLAGVALAAPPLGVAISVAVAFAILMVSNLPVPTLGALAGHVHRPRAERTPHVQPFAPVGLPAGRGRIVASGGRSALRRARPRRPRFLRGRAPRR
jgi:CDP-diacylglycerol--serine O-phosphatidyltransferase